jgi:hypothetical protein
LDSLVIIAGLWLVLIAVYVGLVAYAAYRGRRQANRRQATIRSGALTSSDPTSRGGSFSEVDTLRLQVETLRSQMSAGGGSPRSEKARLRRYASGQYAELPRSLRRQVREVRNYRHAIGV